MSEPLGKLEVAEGEELSGVRRQLEQISSELERIDIAIERIPSLGLVTEHGDNG